MSKILVANIGNRTLIEVRHKGTGIGQKPYISPDGKAHEGNFIYLTQLILDNSWFETVKINIIDKIIDQNINDLTDIYLFVSDQRGDYTSQDTLYAGKILKKLIISKYNFKETQISVIEIKANVIEADKLIPIYRKAILDIKNQAAHVNKKFIFCDSGGTPQQKASMKIVVEYLFKGNNYEYKQVIQKTDYNETFNFENSIVKPIASVEYAKIIADENIILLCQQGAYQGAKFLRLSVTSVHDNIYKVLNFIELRMNRLSYNAKMLVAGLRPPFRRKFPTLDNYGQDTPLGNYTPWQNDFHKEDFFQLCEILSIAQYYWSLSDWSNAVLMYQIFMESYLTFFIKKQKGNSYNLISNRRNTQRNIEQELRNNAATILPHLPNTAFFAGLPACLPTEILYCQYILSGSSYHNQVINTFKDLIGSLILTENNKKGIDELRNDIAHNGIGIASKSTINTKIRSGIDFETVINQWNTAFGLPAENVFIASNREIEDFLRNQVI